MCAVPSDPYRVGPLAFSGKMREVGLHTMYKMVLLAAMAVAASFAPQGSSQPATPGMTLDDSARGEFESSEGRRKLSHVDVTEAGEPCAPNPLRSRVVDLDSYDFGCREIEVRHSVTGVDINSRMGLQG